MKKLLIITIVVISISSCKKDDVNPSLVIPAQIINHVNTFTQEASKRGVNVNIDKYVSSIVLGGPTNAMTPEGGHSAGYYNSGSKEIYIDTTSQNYQQGALFFICHELGHAVLHRDHKNSLFPETGYKQSIMNYSSPINTDLSHIEYYFDELFNPATPYPTWSIN